MMETDKKRHIAVIPARRGSKGFPFKNRLLFDDTADFIDKQSWFSRVIVSTDDAIIEEKARERGYAIHARCEELGGDDVSIKRVMRAVIDDLILPRDVVVWLFYLPVVYKNVADFLEVKGLIEGERVATICGFIPAKSHPFHCWSYDKQKGELRQYVPNDAYRRQDLPPAWTHHHYICCFKAGEIQNLNSELISKKTQPFFLGEDTANHLIEIDTQEHYAQWLASMQKAV